MLKAKLSPEYEFVISVLRHFLNSKTPFQFNSKTLHSLDWDKIIVFSKFQNILTFIYHVLSKHDLLDTIPSANAIEIEKDYFGKIAPGKVTSVLGEYRKK